MSRSYTLAELATRVEGVLHGDADRRIHGVAPVSRAGAGQATWVTDVRFAEQLSQSRASAVLVPPDYGPTPMPAIECRHIHRSTALLLHAFAPNVPRPAVGVHPTAVVDRSATLGTECAIGPHVVIGPNAVLGDRCCLHGQVFIGPGVRMGDGCILWPGVVIREGCVLGRRVVIHPNGVIGADGFGYYLHEGRHEHVPHTGGVTLGDDVEIGACTCIDRAKTGQTVVGRGTKIDNLVQVAHNVELGEHVVIAGQSGMGGSARLGHHVVVGGQVGIIDHVTVGDNAMLAGAMTAITRDVGSKMTVSGMPAQEHRKELREQAMRRRLPELLRQMKELIARVERLEASANDQS